jgi:hypothetical protein
MLNKLKSNGACFGLCLAGVLLCERAARAETTLVEKDGWTFSFDGRVNAFLSVGQGDDLPNPTPNPGGMDHVVMGSNRPNDVPDVGWKSSLQNDASNKYFAMRVRSGLVGNVLGFGLKKTLSDTVSIKGYVSIWSTVESLGRDKWTAVIPEAREGYFTVTAPWGNVNAGRMLELFGRTAWDIDYLYGHGYGVGLPCTDELGPACGHIGTGVPFPGYSAGFVYSTPSLGGLQLHAGIYDPVVVTDWKRAPYLRPEGAITFDTPLSDTGMLRIAAEGLYQPLARVHTVTDPTTMAKSSTDVTTSVWGVAGGVRVEVGPVRLGGSGFHGRGIGLGYALQNTSASVYTDSTTDISQLRTFTGAYGQAAIVIGDVQIGAGYGFASADQLDADKVNYSLSVIHKQTGISAAIYYHATPNVVIGLDYFRFMATWYGAPVDPSTGFSGVLAAEKQSLNFVNAGVTYHW